MPLPDFRVPTSACPYCHTEQDAAAALSGLDGPQVGDPTLCWRCGAWTIFTATLTRRPPTPDETEAIAMDPDTQRAWLYWLAYGPHR